MKRKRVFLGGTCNGSKWRDRLIDMLEIDYFNPVVDDWNEEAQNEEIRQRELCDFVLYTITPKMKGVYSIAEAVDDSNKRTKKTLFCVLPYDDGKRFSDDALQSLNMVSRMIDENGGRTFNMITEVAKFLNQFK